MNSQREAFEKQYCENSGITVSEYRKEYVTLPCQCPEEDCPGWAVVRATPLSIKTHVDLYAPDWQAATEQTEPSGDWVDTVTSKILRLGYSADWGDVSDILSEYARPQPPDLPDTPVLCSVADERARQDGKWGGHEHDDRRGPFFWCQLIQDYAGWARVMAGMDNPVKYRRRMIQIAAIAVAAVESHDRLTLATRQPPENIPDNNDND